MAISNKHRAVFAKIDFRYLDPSRFYMSYSHAKCVRMLVYRNQKIINSYVIKSELIKELYS